MSCDGTDRRKADRMNIRAAFAVALAPLLLTVASCGRYEGYYPQKVGTGEANIFPANYRADILAFLRTYLNDPSGIREAFISEPELKTVQRTDRYAVCVRFNAKKTTGGYEGSKDRIIVFLSGRLDTLVEARRDECANAKYQPFPELERLAR
jgi:hypothetical protein